MQQNNALSPDSGYPTKYTCGDPSPRFSLLFRTPRTRALWRKQDRDELLGLYEEHSNASGSSAELPSRVCPLCTGQESTEEGRCSDCSVKMMDPHGWGHGLFMLDEPSSSSQAGPLLPAFGGLRTDQRAPQSELDSRESSPVDLPTNNNTKADDGDEVSQRGETVAPTTDGEDEDGGDGEIDSDEDADGETDPDFNGEAYWDAVEPSPYLAASIPLPEEDEGENNEEFTNDDGKPVDDFATADEHEGGEEVDAEKNEAEDENEGESKDEGEAGDHTEDPADIDYDDGSDVPVPPVGMSSFKHPDAPNHQWIAEDIALAMIIRRQDENGKVTQAASTEEMMAIFPEPQRVVMVNGRYRCMALARINRTTRAWEEYACGSQSYKRRNDFRRHFTDKHLADQRPEQRCRGESKGKGSGRAQRKRKRSTMDKEEEEEDDDNNADPQSDFVPPANKRARRQ